MTCKQILLDYLKSHPGYTKKVHLYSVAEDFSPETVGRDLRTLEEEGIIHVGYYNGKYANGLAQYSYDVPIVNKRVVTIIDGKVFIT